jgi:hypothetical protein
VAEAHRLVRQMPRMEPVAPAGQATLELIVATFAALQPQAAYAGVGL